MAEKRTTLHLERLAPALRVAGAVLLAAGLVHLYADQRDLPGAPLRGARRAEPRRSPGRLVRGRAHRRRGDRAAARPDGLPPAAGGHRARGRQLRGVPGRLPAHGGGRPRARLLAGRRARGAVGARHRRAGEERPRARPRARGPHPRQAARRRDGGPERPRRPRPLAAGAARPPLPAQRDPGDRLGRAAAVPGHRTAARTPGGAAEGRRGARDGGAGALLPAPARPHGPHAVDP